MALQSFLLTYFPVGVTLFIVHTLYSLSKVRLVLWGYQIECPSSWLVAAEDNSDVTHFNPHIRVFVTIRALALLLLITFYVDGF